MAAAVDPTLQLHETSPLDAALREMQGGLGLGGVALGLLTLSVLLLSATGIYALMSFTVTQRRKEIGIRVALGAHPHRILASIFSRAGRQLASGTLVGLLISVVLDRASRGDLTGGWAVVVIPVVAALMLVVGLLAASGPALRGLRVQPMEALRAE